MNILKLLSHKLLKRIGYDIVKYPSVIDERVAEIPFGSDPFDDIKFYLKDNNDPAIFDVGANVGQSIDDFKKVFPNSFINSFEPAPDTFAKLKEHCTGMDALNLWNFAMGSSEGVLPFQENTGSVMSSFFSPGENWWGEIKEITNVEVSRLDTFADRQKIGFIDILKCDTHGYDLEVF